MFINDNQCRLLLKRYACTSTDRNELARYLYSDLEHLLKLLKMHCPVLANLIDYHGKCIPCISTYAALLKDLSASTPVCALLIPLPEVTSLVNDICDGLEVRKLIDKWKFLQENVPFLYDLFYALGPNIVSLPVEFRPVIKELVRRAEFPFQNTPVHPCVCAGSAASDLHACFPNLPVLWKRHVYKLDNQQDKVCTKVYRGHPSLLPGIFTIFCSHGV